MQGSIGFTVNTSKEYRIKDIGYSIIIKKALKILIAIAYMMVFLLFVGMLLHVRSIAIQMNPIQF